MTKAKAMVILQGSIVVVLGRNHVPISVCRRALVSFKEIKLVTVEKLLYTLRGWCEVQL